VLFFVGGKKGDRAVGWLLKTGGGRKKKGVASWLREAKKKKKGVCPTLLGRKEKAVFCKDKKAIVAGRRRRVC